MTQKSHINLTEDKRLLSAASSLLAQPEGRYFLRQLLATFGIRQSSYMTDSRDHAHAAGFQEAGLLIEHVCITADPQSYVQLMMENN